VGTDVGVFYKDNSLSGWQPYSDGMPNTLVMELEINYATNKLRAATFGRGIWESPLYTATSNPPVVAFSWDGDMICEGDSIRFVDNSLGASASWSWSFPGGLPASSNLQSPKVLYPASGTYQVSLTMSNINGSTLFADNINVQVNPHVIYVNITVDDYPQETSWNIMDGNQQVIGSGGPYDGTPSGSVVTDSVCVADGCFTFEIVDSFGDGICCGFGQGSYNVSTTQLGTFATGGDFGSSESTTFCLVGATGIEELDPIFSVLSTGVDGMYTIVDELADREVSYTVYDTYGRIIENRKSPSAGQINLDLRPFAKGAYLIHLQAGDRMQVLRVTN